MKCLEGYIGVGVNCQTEESVSGKYLTDLAGVTLQNIDAVANANQLSFLGVFADVQKRAISRLSKDVLAYMKTQYNFKKIVNTYFTNGELGDTTSSLNLKHGVRLQSFECESELLRFHVSKVYLYALEEQSTTIYIYSDKVLLYSQALITKIGWNEIYVNKSYDTLDIVVAYDSSVFEEVKKLVFDDTLCDCLCDDCDDVFKQAIQFDTIDDIVQVNNTYGLKVDVSLRCLYDSILCANIDVYSDAYLYSLGMELMRERIYSDRVNRFTTVDKKRAEELLQMYTTDYTEFLQTANDSIRIDNDYCIECLEVSGTEYVMP
jgi:hypothetical protein